MSEWEIKRHPDFLKDLKKLDNKDLNIFYKKIKENPERQKHLMGKGNCYREPITENLRLIYFLDGKVIWLLIISKHKNVYKQYLKRFHSLKVN